MKRSRRACALLIGRTATLATLDAPRFPVEIECTAFVQLAALVCLEVVPRREQRQDASGLVDLWAGTTPAQGLAAVVTKERLACGGKASMASLCAGR